MIRGRFPLPNDIVPFLPEEESATRSGPVMPGFGDSASNAEQSRRAEAQRQSQQTPDEQRSPEEAQALPELSDDEKLMRMDACAMTVLDTINPTSILENREYHWLFCYDPRTREVFATTPVQGDEDGDEHVALDKPAGTVAIGMGHTHGDYAREDRGRVRRTSRSSDSYQSDQFSRGRGGDMSYMRDNPHGFLAFYLGTPSGAYLRYRPGEGVLAMYTPARDNGERLA